MLIINEFDNEYAFLSNFYEKPFIYNGIEYKTAEHAFQAAKCSDPRQAQEIIDAQTPGKAKRLGRVCKLRSDWEDIKVSVMSDIVKAKFEDKELRGKLLETWNCYLIEGNWWHDNCWGNCSCDACRGVKGRNNLGRILMQVREELKNCS